MNAVVDFDLKKEVGALIELVRTKIEKEPHLYDFAVSVDTAMVHDMKDSGYTPSEYLFKTYDIAPLSDVELAVQKIYESALKAIKVTLRKDHLLPYFCKKTALILTIHLKENNYYSNIPNVIIYLRNILKGMLVFEYNMGAIDYYLAIEQWFVSVINEATDEWKQQQKQQNKAKNK